MRFGERLAERVRTMGTCGVVGLDPFLDRVPGIVPGASRAETAEVVRRFCLDVIEVTAPLLPAIKPQAAFFEVLGAAGAAVLEDVVSAARDAGMIVLLDVKRGDIGSTAEAYARAQDDARLNQLSGENESRQAEAFRQLSEGAGISCSGGGG